MDWISPSACREGKSGLSNQAHDWLRTLRLAYSPSWREWDLWLVGHAASSRSSSSIWVSHLRLSWGKIQHQWLKMCTSYSTLSQRKAQSRSLAMGSRILIEWLSTQALRHWSGWHTCRMMGSLWAQGAPHQRSPLIPRLEVCPLEWPQCRYCSCWASTPSSQFASRFSSWACHASSFPQSLGQLSLYWALFSWYWGRYSSLAQKECVCPFPSTSYSLMV